MMDGRTELAVLAERDERSLGEAQSGLSAAGILLRKRGREVKIEFDREVVVDVDPGAYKDPSPYANAAGMSIARVAARMPTDGELTYRISLNR